MPIGNKLQIQWNLPTTEPHLTEIFRRRKVSFDISISGLDPQECKVFRQRQVPLCSLSFKTCFTILFSNNTGTYYMGI